MGEASEENHENNLQNGDVPKDWYEHPVPKPPLPTLEHTLERYMEYARVISECYKIPIRPTRDAVEDFLETRGDIQKKLEEIAEQDENWINHYWLPEMYLKARYPLPINSNPAYIFPKQEFKDESDQIYYAAWLVRGLMEYKQKIDKKQVEREVALSRDGAKLCMNQYDRILSCYREPSLDCDTLHYRREIPERFGDPRNEHVIVMCNEQAFVMYVKIDNKLISHAELVYQLQEIRKRAKSRLRSTVIPVAAGSAGERNEAAKFWALMKTDPINSKSLNWMRAATFTLCLDFFETCMKPSDANYLEHAGHVLLHGYGSKGTGLNRWYDATIQLVVSNDGTNGLCIEHSVAEGIVIINMVESALRFYEKNKNYQNKTNPSLCVNPKGLAWSIDEESKMLLDKQKAEFDGLANDLDLRVLTFTNFGKNKIKSASVSPDGFCQLIMQLAHYRLHGRLVSTYESAAIRRFRLGRVDNIRAATPEALDWVKKMSDPKMSKDCKKTAFYTAAAKQAKVTLENITGHGIDNHLCALQVLSTEAVASGKIAKMPEMFLDKIWYETMRFPLSTSQVTTSLDLPGSYLCYGPVVQDGYGCSYNIQPDKLIYAASCRKSCSETNASKFRDALEKALRDTMALIEPKN